MTTDPVCGSRIDEKSAKATSNYEGQHYSFCSQECKDKFDRSPEQYPASRTMQAGHGGQQQSSQGQQSQSSPQTRKAPH